MSFLALAINNFMAHNLLILLGSLLNILITQVLYLGIPGVWMLLRTGANMPLHLPWTPGLRTMRTFPPSGTSHMDNEQLIDFGLGGVTAARHLAEGPRPAPRQRADQACLRKLVGTSAS
jgi:hypothetical protein